MHGPNAIKYARLYTTGQKRRTLALSGTTPEVLGRCIWKCGSTSQALQQGTACYGYAIKAKLKAELPIPRDARYRTWCKHAMKTNPNDDPDNYRTRAEYRRSLYYDEASKEALN